MGFHLDCVLTFDRDVLALYAAVIDERFRGAFLFDSYLPRDALMYDVIADDLPSARPSGLRAGDWATYFPILAG